MTYASRRDVVLRQPFKPANLDAELPAGSYVVSTEVRFISANGRTGSYNTNFLEIPSGVLSQDHTGSTLLISDAELTKAEQ